MDGQQYQHTVSPSGAGHGGPTGDSYTTLISSIYSYIYYSYTTEIVIEFGD